MCLRKDISILSFFQAVDQCTGDVLLHTRQGDTLNLRSQLCRYIFAVAFSEESLFDGARVEVQTSDDLELLKSYLTE